MEDESRDPPATRLLVGLWNEGQNEDKTLPCNHRSDPEVDENPYEPFPPETSNRRTVIFGTDSIHREIERST